MNLNMKTIEEWKVIEDFPEYEVSSFGRIKRSNKFLTPTKKSDGYFKINLRLNKVPKTVYVHRIAAKAFVENPNNYNCVNHKDENKANNNADNLEWCDTYYNNIYGTKTLRQANAISKKVLVIDKDNNVKKYNSLDDVAIALNCCKSNVSRVIDRPTKRCKGYKIISDIIYK